MADHRKSGRYLGLSPVSDLRDEDRTVTAQGRVVEEDV